MGTNWKASGTTAVQKLDICKRTLILRRGTGITMSEHELIQRAIELCLAVYRVTDRFPANEVLREKLRGISLDLIAGIIYDAGNTPTEKSRFLSSEKLVKIIKAYFDIAGRQDWVDPKNFAILSEAYKFFGEECGGLKQGKIEQFVPSERQKEILRFLESGEEKKAEEIARALKLSTKTIFRDLKPMVGAGIVRKSGATKAAKFYITLLKN